MFMQKVNTCSCLHEIVKSFIFLKVRLLLNKLEQISSADVLHYEVDEVLVFQTRIEASDILMLKFFMDIDFSKQRIANSLAFKTIFVYLFYC